MAKINQFQCTTANKIFIITYKTLKHIGFVFNLKFPDCIINQQKKIDKTTLYRNLILKEIYHIFKIAFNDELTNTSDRVNHLKLIHVFKIRIKISPKYMYNLFQYLANMDNLY